MRLTGLVVTPAGVAPGAVVVEGARITTVEPVEGRVPRRYLCPGLVDLQVNGYADVDVATADGDAWERIAGRLSAAGTTAWCPTLVTAPLDHYAPALERIGAAAGRLTGSWPAAGAAILGAHLEGPFLGGRPGAHCTDWIRGCDLDWLASLPALVRVLTLAPEAERAAEAISLLAGRGVLVALGHSAATHDQVRAAVDAGARLATHLFNGMAPLHHREPGIVGAALADDRLATSLIADLVHVHPAALRVAFRAKGPGRVVLVSDSVGWEAPQLGGAGLRFEGIVPTRADGTLSGSAITLAEAVANVVEHAGVPVTDAVAAAATNPATLLGDRARGLLAPGLRADLVELDADSWTARRTLVGGVVVHEA